MKMQRRIGEIELTAPRQFLGDTKIEKISNDVTKITIDPDTTKEKKQINAINK